MKLKQPFVQERIQRHEIRKFFKFFTSSTFFYSWTQKFGLEMSFFHIFPSLRDEKFSPVLPSVSTTAPLERNGAKINKSRPNWRNFNRWINERFSKMKLMKKTNCSKTLKNCTCLRGNGEIFPKRFDEGGIQQKHNKNLPAMNAAVLAWYVGWNMTKSWLTSLL